MKKFFILMALALPLTMMTSCKKDVNENVTEKQEKPGENSKRIDGIEYMKAKLYTYDENGNVDGVNIGKFVMKNEPTTAYLGVDTQEDAQRRACSLFPQGSAKIEGNNIVFTLTDTLGVKQGCAYYTSSYLGDSFGMLTFDESLGVDKNLITSIKFIDKTLWPENAPAGSTGFKAGKIYKYNGTIKTCMARDIDAKTSCFICTREPANGERGILFIDFDKSTSFDSCSESRSEEYTTNFPSEHWMSELAKDMSGANVLYWQQIAAITNTTVSNVKKRWYFTHEVENGDDDIKLYCLGTRSSYWYNPPFWPLDDRPKYQLSKLYTFDIVDGEPRIYKDCAGAWSSKHRSTNLSYKDFDIDNDMMAKARAINPND